MATFHRYYAGPLDGDRKVWVPKHGPTSPPKYHMVVNRTHEKYTRAGDVYWHILLGQWLMVDPDENGNYLREAMYEVLLRPNFNNQVTIE